MVARAEPADAYVLAAPMRFVFPKYFGTVCIDGIGEVIEKDLAQSSGLLETTEGTRHFFTPKQSSGLQEGSRRSWPWTAPPSMWPPPPNSSARRWTGRLRAGAES